MNRTLLPILAVGVTALVLGSSTVYAHEVKNGQAVELVLHRLERLIDLKKITDEDFRTKIKSVSLEPIPHQNEEDPSFKGTIFLYPPSDPSQKQKSVEIQLDEEGRPIRNPLFKLNNGGAPSGAPTWPEKDAVSLAEVALHCVQGQKVGDSDACAKEQGLAAFNNAFTSLELSQIKAADGTATGALIDVRAAGLSQVAKIRLTLSGSLDPARPVEFVVPAEGTGADQSLDSPAPAL